MYKLILLTVVLAFVILTSSVLGQESSITGQKCTIDTDNGKNFLIKGTVAGLNENYTDTCSPLNGSVENLIEYSCKFSGSEYGFLEVTNQDCSQLGDYKCVEGACVNRVVESPKTSTQITPEIQPGPILPVPVQPFSVTVPVPQPVIGSKCAKTSDGAKITRPVTGQEIPYTDFEAEGERVTYGCNVVDVLTQTRTKIQNKEPEKIESSERKKIDIAQYPRVYDFFKEAAQITKEDVLGVLLIAAFPNIMMLNAAGSQDYCKDTDTTPDGNSDNPFAVGTATLVIKGKQVERRVDICDSLQDHGVTRYMLELVCSPGGFFSNPSIKTVRHDCLAEYGAECYQGVCYEFEPRQECLDSDGGNQPTSAGWVIPKDGGVAILDKCNQPSSRVFKTRYKRVLERECRPDGTVGTVDTFCGNGRRCENILDATEDACTSGWVE